MAQHHIEIKEGSKPFKIPCYAVPQALEEAMYAELDKKLADGIVEETQSDWSSPVVMVKKSDGKYRMCQDYRRLNEITVKDVYPLPKIDSILSKLRDAKYITKLDLSQAFHQIVIDPESRPLTAFGVPGRGTFRYKRLPFGLCNGPSSLQRIMDRLLGPKLEPHVFKYLDNIIIVTETFEEHLEWVEKVLAILKEANLTINPEKSEFCCAEVKYLGFVVNRYGLQTDPDKVAPIRDYPAPRTVREVRKFVGMTSWYRNFIPNFATRVAPVNKLIRKKQEWIWGPEQQAAFEDIKSCLMQAPTLTRPDFTKPFFLHTDASITGLGAVLMQVDEHGVEHPIAYASRSLHGAEANYTVSEMECLAVIWGIEKFRCYLEGRQFTVVTDHSCLLWLRNIKNPTGRLARWAMKLLAYDITIVHKKGSTHTIPDALSRMYESPREEEVNSLHVPPDWYKQRMRDVQRDPHKFRNWDVHEGKLYYQYRDPLKDEVTHNEYEWKYVVPENERQQVLEENHDNPQAAHLGVEKTYARLIHQYFWPGIYRDVIEYIRNCKICQAIKVSQAKPVGYLGERILETPWCTVAADIMGPLPKSSSGYSYLLVMQDLFTKWIEIAPLRSANGNAIANQINKLVITRWGTPKVLHSDNGTEFKNKVIEEYAKDHQIHHSYIPPYRAEANPVERVNRVMKTMIMAYVGQDHRKWDSHLEDFRFAYNTSKHASTKMTPAFLNLGRELEPLSSLRREKEEITLVEASTEKDWARRMKRLGYMRDWITENLERAHARQARWHDRKRRHLVYEPNHRVWIRNHVLSRGSAGFAAKLAKKWVGPYTVTRVISPLVYEVTNIDGKIKTAYVNDLKPYRETLASPEDEKE